MKVAVVGGGAAGLMAAITAANHGAEVWIYESCQKVVVSKTQLNSVKASVIEFLGRNNHVCLDFSDILQGHLFDANVLMGFFVVLNHA